MGSAILQQSQVTFLTFSRCPDSPLKLSLCIILVCCASTFSCPRLGVGLAVLGAGGAVEYEVSPKPSVRQNCAGLRAQGTGGGLHQPEERLD